MHSSVSPQVYELQMRAGTFLVEWPHKVRCRKDKIGPVKRMCQERGLASCELVSQLVGWEASELITQFVSLVQFNHV